MLNPSNILNIFSFKVKAFQQDFESKWVGCCAAFWELSFVTQNWLNQLCKGHAKRLVIKFRKYGKNTQIKEKIYMKWVTLRNEWGRIGVEYLNWEVCLFPPLSIFSRQMFVSFLYFYFLDNGNWTQRGFTIELRPSSFHVLF